MFEYIVTIFKVVAGVITNERLVIASLIALGLLLLWIGFSLCFSFEMRFLSGAKKINKYISRNGIGGEHKQGLSKLVQKMPTEFVRGYHTFEKNPHSLPSEFIKRSDCLDLELNGGVFNQNRSIIKSYINMVFFALLVFSFAIMSSSSLFDSGSATSETALTGYMVAEAMLIPFLFLLLAKGFYYIYTAIRQHQYHVAVEEFNEMIDNFDKEAMDTYGYIPTSLTVMSSSRQKPENVSEIKVEEKPQIVPVALQKEPEMPTAENQDETGANQENPVVQEENFESEPVEETVSETRQELEEQEPVSNEENNFEDEYLEPETANVQAEVEENQVEEQDFSDENNHEELNSVQEPTIDEVQENELPVENEEYVEENGDFGADEKQEQSPYNSEDFATVANEESDSQIFEDEPEFEEVEPEDDALSLPLNEEAQNEEPVQDDFEEENTKNTENEEDNTMENNEEIKDNFKPDFASLLGEDVQKKRGRGRPKKETNGEEEFTIKTDKDFEDALVRAEKLMRKNEEPLSASQTKRIEKQLKELIDAMSKYKENK